MDKQFDGDQMDIMFSPSLEYTKGFEKFAPFRALPNFNQPTQLSASAALEPELVMNISNFIRAADNAMAEIIGE